VEFTTVSPCFVATVAYGHPLAAEVGVLRQFRDRYLMSHTPGRALVSAYYAYGAPLADWIESRPDAKRRTRQWLDVVVHWTRALLEPLE
jgi:hypothetical protein